MSLRPNNLNEKIEATGRNTMPSDIIERGRNGDPTGGRATGSSSRLSPQSERAVRTGSGGLF